MPNSEMEVLANRFVDAVEQGDAAEIESIYAAGLVVWPNYDGIEQSREEAGKSCSKPIGSIPWISVRQN